MRLGGEHAPALAPRGERQARFDLPILDVSVARLFAFQTDLSGERMAFQIAPLYRLGVGACDSTSSSRSGAVRAFTRFVLLSGCFTSFVLTSA
ncbi:hypothetical protein D3C86_2053910 [compost metagenome]